MLSFSRRLKDYVTFKMYTWHTVHGESVVEITVKLLGVVFADFTRPTMLSKVLSIFMCRFTSLVVTGLFLVNIVYAKSIGDIARVTESVMVGLQTINDQIFGIGLMHAKFEDIYNKRKNFWSRKVIDPEDTCNDSKKQKLVLMFGNAFLLLLHAAYIVFILSYILYRKLDIWVPESHPKIAFALSIYSMTWGIFSVTGSGIFNLLIVSFCVELQVQFQLINYRLRKMEITWQKDSDADKESIIKEMKEIAKHHTFLLTYWKDIREAFSLLLFVRLFEAVCTLCMGMFIVTADESTSLYDAIRSILLNGCLISQLLVMVFSSEIVEDETADVFKSAYHTPWMQHKEIISYIKVLMTRAIVTSNLTAGGFVDVNKLLLTAILRTTFFYYTAMKTFAGLD